MYFLFLGEVFRRAFHPMTRVTDMLQILTAAALPAISMFLGIKMPETIGNEVAAYIAAIAVCFVAIRLLWAPYSIWREDKGCIAKLHSDLIKPERIELSRLAKLRARNRAKLAGEIRILSVALFDNDDAEFQRRARRIFRLAGMSGLSKAANSALAFFIEISSHFHENCLEANDNTLLIENYIIEHLHGKLSDDDLWGALRVKELEFRIQSPQDIESKKQP